MPGSYSEKRIDLKFQLGKGSFGGSGFNEVTFQGLRVETQIQQAGLPTVGAIASIRAYGMTLSQMNQLSKAGLVWEHRLDKVLLMAGDGETGMSEVFQGDIIEAYPDFDQPNSPFFISAKPGSGLQMKPVDPVTIEGSVSGVQALEQIVKQAGLKVENSGVNVQLVNPYFPGTVWDQVRRCVAAMDCFAYYDNRANTLAVWPKNKARDGGGEPEISAATGMIGYPKFQNVMINVRKIFDPKIKFGTKFTVKSGLTAADGRWNAVQIVYNLASQQADGPWEMVITGNKEPQQTAGATSGEGKGASTNL